MHTLSTPYQPTLNSPYQPIISLPTPSTHSITTHLSPPQPTLPPLTTHPLDPSTHPITSHLLNPLYHHSPITPSTHSITTHLSPSQHHQPHYHHSPITFSTPPATLSPLTYHLLNTTSHMNDRLRSGIVSGTYYQKYVAAALPIEGCPSQHPITTSQHPFTHLSKLSTPFHPPLQTLSPSFQHPLFMS